MTSPTSVDRPAAHSRRIAVGLAGLQFGGCQINAIDLARTLRARGHDVSVFAVRDDAVPLTILPYADKAGFDVTLLPDGRGAWGTANSIASYARKRDIEVVHVFAPWLNRPAAIASALDPRLAVVETNWNMENMFWGSSRVPLIVGTGSMLEEAAPRRRAAVHLMEPPIDTEMDRPDGEAGARFRADLGIRDDTTLAVLVSRVDKVMKLESIIDSIDAVRRLDDHALDLVIVGDGDALDTVRAAAADANASLGRTAVRVIGALRDPRPAYNAADIVLGMGGAAIRGLAHGKPVIVLGERGFSLVYEPDAIAHFRREGFYGIGEGIPGGEALARRLDGLLRSRERRDALGAFGLREVDERFGLPAATRSLEEIYAEAIVTSPPVAERAAIGLVQLVRSAAQRLRAAVRPPR